MHDARISLRRTSIPPISSLLSETHTTNRLPRCDHPSRLLLLLRPLQPAVYHRQPLQIRLSRWTCFLSLLIQYHHQQQLLLLLLLLVFRTLFDLVDNEAIRSLDEVDVQVTQWTQILIHQGTNPELNQCMNELLSIASFTPDKQRTRNDPHISHEADALRLQLIDQC